MWDGSHYPATHGLLRLLATLEGEVVRDIKPIATLAMLDPLLGDRPVKLLFDRIDESA